LHSCLCVLIGIGCVGLGLPAAIDWTAPPDVVTTIVERTTVTWRGTATIHTATGAHRVAMFWHPSVDAGPARLTLGHFSGVVLRVEQPVPGSPP
jgi:hypothetical protein